MPDATSLEMSKPMKKRSVKPFRPVYPSPAALITSVSEDGHPNIITLGEVFNLSISEPVIVGIAIAKPRYSHQLITATREYVVNFPTSAMVKTVDRCGSVSGRDVDKFAEFGLTPAECLAGVTREAARALGLDDRGVLDVGNRADIAEWAFDHPRELAYWHGGNPLSDLLIAGQSAGPSH